MNNCKQCEDVSAVDLMKRPECETAYEAAQPGTLSVQSDVIGYGVWNTGANPGTRLQRYDGLVAISPEKTSHYTVPVYSQECMTRLQEELKILKQSLASAQKQLEEATAQRDSFEIEFMTKEAEIKLGDEYAAYIDARCQRAESDLGRSRELLRMVYLDEGVTDEKCAEVERIISLPLEPEVTQKSDPVI